MNAPTLIVGLGGAGSKVVSRVSRLVNEEQRRNIEFVVMDTDINELRDVMKACPSVHTIQTSDKQRVSDYLAHNSKADAEWFPKNNILNNKVATEGAGQVRAISRLVLDKAISEGKMKPLLDAIKELYTISPNPSDQALRVIIVSSLAGGTGSGILLPMAMFIKNHLDTHYIQNAAIIRGFFLLPEVFDLVIPEAERRLSMRRNAYAALREIDAFLMAGDNSLPAKYKNSFTFNMKKPGVPNEYEEYRVRPYDFCFLFDAQNANGESLKSYAQYLDHAASCIYAQAIGPTNKRSNSSEDNTIMSTVAENGRNRYAGAGSSRLVYPTKDIQQYMSLHWAKQCISDQWLSIDREYKRRLEEHKKNIAKGAKEKDLEPGKEYIRIVEDGDNAFFENIKNAFVHHDVEDPTKQTGELWLDYVDAIRAKIERDESVRLQSEISRINADNSLKGITGDNGPDQWEDFAEAYEHLEQYYRISKAGIDEIAKYNSRSMFRYDVIDPANIEDKYRLEYYLFGADHKDFQHPNAVRYFIYKAIEAMTEARADVVSVISTKEKYLNTFEDEEIDDPTTTDKKERAAELGNRRVRIREKIKKRMTDEQCRLHEAFTNYLISVDELRTNKILEKTLDEGIAYLNKIAKAFNSFYAAFEIMVNGMDGRMNTIADKYADNSGETVRYVCTSKECIEALANELTYNGGSLNPDSDLCAGIYTKIREYSQLFNDQDEKTSGKFFDSIFEKQILGFFVDSIMEKYSNIVDLDIIEALKREVQVTQNTTDSDIVEKTMSDIVESTKRLACPFIEKPIAYTFDEINACTYNKDMVDAAQKAGGFKIKFVERYLSNSGGACDNEIPKNEIVFYRAFYGIRANSLSKFAPPSESRKGGEYYDAYFNAIKSINPKSTESKVVSPHLDRWWHLVSKMPDLDENNQINQEKKTYAAFLWGLLGNYFMFLPKGIGGVYKYKKETLRMESGDGSLIVSNGTDCDHIYELLDAVSIYPELVDKIMAKVEDRIERDVDASAQTSLKDSFLFSCIEKFRVDEFPLGGNCPDENASKEERAKYNRVRSLFDIPILMRDSVTSDMLEYFEKTASDMLQVILSEIERYLSRLCSEEETKEILSNLIVEQYDMFIRDIEEEKAQHKIKNIFKSSLFVNMNDIITSKLESLGYPHYIKKIEERIEDYI